MKGLKLFLVTVVAVSFFAATYAKNGQRIGRGTVKEAVQVAFKAKRAVSKAGIKKSNPKYKEAVGVVSLLGPLGVDTMLGRITEALREGVITLDTANRIIFFENGRSLAYFFGMQPTAFMEMAKRRGVFDVVRQTGTETFADGWRRFVTWMRGVESVRR